MAVTLTGFSDKDGHYSSETFFAEVDGQAFQVEEWHTDNADGTELEGGENFELTPDQDKELDAKREKFGEVYYDLWRQLVKPVEDEVIRRALEIANATTVNREET